MRTNATKTYKSYTQSFWLDGLPSGTRLVQNLSLPSLDSRVAFAPQSDEGGINKMQNS